MINQTYIIESILATGIMYVIYFLALHNRPMLVFNRFVLLSMVVLGIVLPLIKFQLPETTEIPTSSIIVEAIEYSTADFATYSEIPRQINYWHLIYFSVTSALLVYLLFRLIEIQKFRRKSAICEKGDFSYHLIQGKYSHFSFFKTIFINKSLVETDEELNSILEHEKVHVKQKHTFDILFLEFLKVFLWFNPFLWLFKKCVTENHEYLADRNMLKNTSKNIVDYFNELLHSSLRTTNISLANNFNHSILKKRVVMMTKKRFKRTERIILFIIVSCIALTSVFFSCKKENLVDKNTIGEVIKLGEWPPKGYLDPKGTEITSEGEKIHFYPEKMPMFKGKDFNEFRNYIKENLIYPDEAKLNGWEGKVSVRFNISSEGKVIDATRIGGTDNILSDEALRVIQSSPDWKPGSEDGKNVAVQFTFPVIFSMGEKSPKKYTPLNPNNIVNDFKQGISAEWHYRKQNEDTVIITIKARIPHGHEFFENSISGNVDVEFIINKTLKQLENLQIVSSDHPMLSEDAKERIIHCAKSGIFTAQIENKYPKAKYFQIHYAYVFDLF